MVSVFIFIMRKGGGYVVFGFLGDQPSLLQTFGNIAKVKLSQLLLRLQTTLIPTP
jgi:hypothetical protein